MSHHFNSSWVPPEPPALLHVEVVIMQSTLLGNIAYGLHCAVFMATLHAIWTAGIKRRPWLMAVFAICLFTCGTLYVVAEYHALQWSFVNYRNFPGGPGALYPIITTVEPLRFGWGGPVAVFTTWLSDAMLMWRCYTIWSKKVSVMIIPSLLWVSSVVFGSLFCYEARRPAQSLNLATQERSFTLVFWAVSLTLNMLLSGLILFRLLHARANATTNLGPEYGRTYLSIAAIIVESALIYATMGFTFIVLYGVNALNGLVLQEALVQVEAIAPQLIILRIARGHAWNTKTSLQLTGTAPVAPLRFAQSSGTDGSRTFQTKDISMVNLRNKNSEGDLKETA